MPRGNSFPEELAETNYLPMNLCVLQDGSKDGVPAKVRAKGALAEGTGWFRNIGGWETLREQKGRLPAAGDSLR